MRDFVFKKEALQISIMIIRHNYHEYQKSSNFMSEKPTMPAFVVAAAAAASSSQLAFAVRPATSAV
jgi:hypothetical protein